MALTFAVILFIQDSPFIYYAYAGFPIFFWEHVISNRETVLLGLQVLTKSNGKRIPHMTVASQSILYIGILESLVPAPHTICPVIDGLGIRILSPPYFQYLFRFCRAVAINLWLEFCKDKSCVGRVLGGFLCCHE